jgi:hypothetical protein
MTDGPYRPSRSRSSYKVRGKGSAWACPFKVACAVLPHPLEARILASLGQLVVRFVMTSH